VTTYDYDANTGELIEIDYSDSTPDVAFTYDRLGRKTEVKEGTLPSGMTMRHEFAYADDAGSSLLRLAAETVTRDGYTKVINRQYQDGTGYTVKGRDAGFYIGTQPSPEYEVTYAYDNDESGGTG